MRIIVSTPAADDMGAIAGALGAVQGVEVLAWEVGEPLPNRDDPVLLDLRADLPDLVDLFQGDSAQPLLVVADETAVGRLQAVPATNPWALLVDLEPEGAVAFISAKVAHWQQRARRLDGEAYQRDKRISDIEARYEDQSVELMVRNGELSRLVAFKSGVLSRLGDAEHGYIADLLRHVSDFEKHEDLGGALKNIQNNLHHTAVNIQHIFRSFDFWAKTERELQERSILIVAMSRKFRRLMSRALADSQATIHSVSTKEEGLEFLRDGFVDLLFVDWDNAGIISEAQAIRPELKTVLLTSELLFEGFGEAMLELPLQNVLITSDVALSEEDDEPLLLRELAVTAGKLLGDNIFGIEKYLSWGTKIHETLVTNTDQRFEILDKIREFAPQTGLRRSMCQNLETLTDELLMNALWDAPVDETGHHKYASLSRRKAVQLLPHECPILRYGSDGRLVGISVTDPFGGLERDHAYRYLVKCFARQSNQIDTKRGGAGLGLYTAFLSVSTMIINVAPGFRTEVIGLLDTKLSRRKMSGRSRTYHFYVSEGPPRR